MSTLKEEELLHRLYQEKVIRTLSPSLLAAEGTIFLLDQYGESRLSHKYSLARVFPSLDSICNYFLCFLLVYCLLNLKYKFQDRRIMTFMFTAALTTCLTHHRHKYLLSKFMGEVLWWSSGFQGVEFTKSHQRDWFSKVPRKTPNANAQNSS